MNEHFFSPETWGSFNEKILQVGALAGSLLDFSTALQDRSGLPLNEVLAEFPEFAPAVLGGVSRDGAYGESSLAGVFRSLLGATIDTRQYCSRKAIPGEDAEASVSLQVESSRVDQYSIGPGDFRALLRSARSLAEQALEAWQPGLSSRIVQGQGEVYFRQPAKAVEDTQALLQALAALSAGVDELATFLYLTRRITWRYLVATFPRVQEPEALTFLQKRLGLERLWEPDPNPADGYTLWGYPAYRPWSRDDFCKGVNTATYGDSVLALSSMAWLLFSDLTGSAYTGWGIAAAVFASPPNLPQLFWKRAQGQLTRIRRPACPFPNEDTGEGLKIRGPLAVSYWHSRRGNYGESQGVSVHTLLDWLTPSVCYGERELTPESTPQGSGFRIIKLLA